MPEASVHYLILEGGMIIESDTQPKDFSHVQKVDRSFFLEGNFSGLKEEHLQQGALILDPRASILYQVT